MKTVCFAAGPAKMDPKAKKKLCELIEKDPSIVEKNQQSETFQKILMQTKQTTLIQTEMEWYMYPRLSLPTKQTTTAFL